MSPTDLNIGVVAGALTPDPRRAPRFARQLGFSGVLIDAVWGTLDITTLAASGLRELRHLFASESQQVIGLRTELGAKGLMPGADIDRILSGLERIMEAAAGLAAPLLCLDVGLLPEPAPVVAPAPVIPAELAGPILIPTPAPPPPAATREDPAAPDPAHVSLMGAALEELGKRADRFSVTIALRSGLSSFTSLKFALRSANCPWFGVDLDPPAILQDKWGPDEIFSALGAEIRHVRARDAVRGTDHRTRPVVIGSGSTDWPAMLAALDAAGFHGWLTIDPTDLSDRPAAAGEGIAYLRKIAGRK
jgi:sugar phosphate isomerase/epimerase